MLISGVSGVGKTSVLDELIRINNKFQHMFLYTTRQIRKGEEEYRKTKPKDYILALEKENKLLYKLEKYGVLFCCPKNKFYSLLRNGKYPAIEFSIDEIKMFKKKYPNVFTVYLYPPSLKTLHNRLMLNNRDPDGHRFAAAIEELQKVKKSTYKDLIDIHFVSYEDDVKKIAEAVNIAYKK